jgi:hypothetical protein
VAHGVLKGESVLSSLRTLWQAFPEECLAFLSSVIRKGKSCWLDLAYHGAKPTLLLGVIPGVGLALGVLESSLGFLTPMVAETAKKCFL